MLRLFLFIAIPGQHVYSGIADSKVDFCCSQWAWPSDFERILWLQHDQENMCQGESIVLCQHAYPASDM